MFGIAFPQGLKLSEIVQKLGKKHKSAIQPFRDAWHSLAALFQNTYVPIKLGGKNKIVEGDEALMGKKHSLLAHGNQNKTMKIWVYGMAERAPA